jgi:hypothetical protein
MTKFLIEHGTIIDNIFNPLNRAYNDTMSTETEPQTSFVSAPYLFHWSERLISPVFYV